MKQHTNTHRPIVGVWVYIVRPDMPDTLVIRKSWITTRSYNLVYFDQQDNIIEGEFPWYYP